MPTAPSPSATEQPYSRTTTADGGGAWNFTPAGLGLADGTYLLTATETDLAGNTGSASLSFTLDTTAPGARARLTWRRLRTLAHRAPITSPTRPHWRFRHCRSRTRWSPPQGAFNSSTVIGSGQADATGAWSIATDALAAGVHVSPPRRPMSPATSAWRPRRCRSRSTSQRPAPRRRDACTGIGQWRLEN